MLALVDAPHDDITQALCDGVWHELPIELRGRFVDPADACENQMWRRDLIEYINNHPELRFQVEERTFHICRAHPAAREVVENGIVPNDFVCPAGNEACPFQLALAMGNGEPLVFDPSWGRTRLRIAT